MNRNLQTQTTGEASDLRHSPLYRREKLQEQSRREDAIALSGTYCRSLIDDKFDHDLEKFYGVQF